MSLNHASYSLPPDIDDAVRANAGSWSTNDTIAKIWAKDAGVWTNEDESKWLGWLEIVGEELGDIAKYRELASDIEDAEFKVVSSKAVSSQAVPSRPALPSQGQA